MIFSRGALCTVEVSYMQNRPPQVCFFVLDFEEAVSYLQETFSIQLDQQTNQEIEETVLKLFSEWLSDPNAARLPSLKSAPPRPDLPALTDLNRVERTFGVPVGTAVVPTTGDHRSVSRIASVASTHKCLLALCCNKVKLSPCKGSTIHANPPRCMRILRDSCEYPSLPPSLPPHLPTSHPTPTHLPPLLLPPPSLHETCMIHGAAAACEAFHFVTGQLASTLLDLHRRLTAHLRGGSRRAPSQGASLLAVQEGDFNPGLLIGYLGGFPELEKRLSVASSCQQGRQVLDEISSVGGGLCCGETSTEEAVGSPDAGPVAIDSGPSSTAVPVRAKTVVFDQLPGLLRALDLDRTVVSQSAIRSGGQRPVYVWLSLILEVRSLPKPISTHLSHLERKHLLRIFHASLSWHCI